MSIFIWEKKVKDDLKGKKKKKELNTQRRKARPRKESESNKQEEANEDVAKESHTSHWSRVIDSTRLHRSAKPKYLSLSLSHTLSTITHS